MTNSLGSAGRNAVKRALRLPRSFIGKMHGVGGVFQRMGKGRLPVRMLLLFRDEVDYKSHPLHFRDDVGGYALPRLRATVGSAIAEQMNKTTR
ncbi:MAG: hypothetical protein KGJ57_23355 [Sphingomonadales bacterium]|nr:hypothetical protein [Sphingomonadales bacterium]